MERTAISKVVRPGTLRGPALFRFHPERRSANMPEPKPSIEIKIDPKDFENLSGGSGPR